MFVISLVLLLPDPTPLTTGLGTWPSSAHSKRRTHSSWPQGWLWWWVIAWKRNNQCLKDRIMTLLSWDVVFIRADGKQISLSGYWTGGMCVWNALHPFLLPYGKNLSAIGGRKPNQHKESSRNDWQTWSLWLWKPQIHPFQRTDPSQPFPALWKPKKKKSSVLPKLIWWKFLTLETKRVVLFHLWH